MLQKNNSTYPSTNDSTHGSAFASGLQRAGKYSKATEPTTIFVHIPKTAGTTMTSILKSQYDLTRSIEFYGKEALPRIQKLRNLPHFEKRNFSLLYGHVEFGIHQWVPHNCTYITLLREPIDRIISHYHYVLRVHCHYLHQKVTGENMDLKEYMSAGLSKELNDSQTRFLCKHGFQYDYNSCPDKMLSEAAEILDNHFVVIGLNEFFDESILMMKKALNWKIPFYQRKNITANRPKLNDFPEETIETVKKYNRLDLELYRYLTKRLKDRIAALGLSFKYELEAFRVLNKHWQQFVAPQVKREQRKLAQEKWELEQKEQEKQEQPESPQQENYDHEPPENEKNELEKLIQENQEPIPIITGRDAMADILNIMKKAMAERDEGYTRRLAAGAVEMYPQAVPLIRLVLPLLRKRRQSPATQ